MSRKEGRKERAENILHIIFDWPTPPRGTAKAHKSTEPRPMKENKYVD